MASQELSNLISYIASDDSMYAPYTSEVIDLIKTKKSESKQLIPDFFGFIGNSLLDDDQPMAVRLRMFKLLRDVCLSCKGKMIATLSKNETYQFTKSLASFDSPNNDDQNAYTFFKNCDDPFSANQIYKASCLFVTELNDIFGEDRKGKQTKFRDFFNVVNVLISGT